MAGKNTDVKKIKREGILDAQSMKIEYYDDKTESTHVYDLSQPFKEYHEQDVVITVQIDINADAEKEVDYNGEVNE